MFKEWYPQDEYLDALLGSATYPPPPPVPPLSSNAESEPVTRRGFIASLAGTGVAASILGGTGGFIIGNSSTGSQSRPIKWNLLTPWNGSNSFSKDIEEFAEKINDRLWGKLNIRVRNELFTPPDNEKKSLQEVYKLLKDPNDNTIHMLHASPYYHNQSEAGEDDWNNPFFFFSSIPFGLDSKGLNKWLGDSCDDWKNNTEAPPEGYSLWKELCNPMNIEVFPGGNTSQQFSGWWRLPNQPTGWKMSATLFSNLLNERKARIMGFARKVL